MSPETSFGTYPRMSAEIAAAFPGGIPREIPARITFTISPKSTDSGISTSIHQAVVARIPLDSSKSAF